MLPYYIGLAFLFGLGVGSFLNVVIFRFHSGESIVSPGSKCFSCNQSLKWLELIPVFSFIFQGGKCRQCQSKISVQYPIVELVSGIIFSLTIWHIYLKFAIWNFQSIASLILVFAFFGLLLAMSVYDIRHQIIPDIFNIILAVISVIFAYIYSASFFASILSGIGASLFFIIIWLVSKGEWMGLGDGKLAFSLGVFLSWPLVIVGLMLAFWIGAVWGIVFLIAGVYGRKSQIPFGPFLALGTFIAFLAGEAILSVILPYGLVL